MRPTHPAPQLPPVRYRQGPTGDPRATAASSRHGQSAPSVLTNLGLTCIAAALDCRVKSSMLLLREYDSLCASRHDPHHDMPRKRSRKRHHAV